MHLLGRLTCTYKSLIIAILATILMVFLMPFECFLQVRAANSPPYTGIGRSYIVQGYVGFISILVYRVVVLIFVTLPVRTRVLHIGFISVLKKDLVLTVIPLIITYVVNVALIIYVMSSLFVSVWSYGLAVLIGSIIMVSTSVYVSIYGIPRTVFSGSRKTALLKGLAVSIPSSLLALFLTLLFSLFGEIYLFKCSAQQYGVEVVNPNTPLIESMMSVGLFGLIVNIVWYYLYSRLLLYVYTRGIVKH